MRYTPRNRPASHTYMARVRRDDLTGLVELTVIADDDIAEVADGDEFITIDTRVDLFPRSPQ